MTDEESKARDARWERQEEIRAKEMEANAKYNERIAEENAIRRQIVDETGGLDAWLRKRIAREDIAADGSIRYHTATASYLETRGPIDDRIVALLERCAGAEERQATAWESLAQSLASIAARPG